MSDPGIDAMFDTEVYSRVSLKPASDLVMRPVEWAWPGWLAKGKLHIVGGPPGVGKTTVVLSLAGTLSAGGRWPDGARCTSGNVLIWSAEDDPADTLLPRLVAAGADLDRVFFIEHTTRGSETRSFDPSTDVAILASEAQRIGDVDLVMIDPIVSAVAGDSHKNSETRRALQPIVDMASTLDAAVVGITHFSKGTSGRDPTERVTGSIAFGALARVVMVCAKRQEGEQGGSRMLARAKSNIGADGGGFGYDLEQVQVARGIEASRVVWGDPLEGNARDLLDTAEATTESPRDEAADWLTDMLAVCPVQVKTLRKEAADAGIAWRTLERAKNAIGARAVRQSIGNDGKGTWVWQLPAEQDRQATTTEKVAVLGFCGGVAGDEFARSARPPDFERGDVGGLADTDEGAQP